VGEGGSPTAGQPTLSQVLFTPHTLGGYTDITRQFAEQTSLDAEAFVIDDLTKSLGVSLDVAAFVGSGSNNQPTGIVNTSGVNIIALGTNGAEPTFGNLVNMETQVAAANADLGDMSYVVTPAARGYLKTVPRSTSAVAAGFVFEDNEINGYAAYATNVLPSNGTKGTGTNLSTAVFGNYNDLVIGMWGGLDVMVDPYTGSSSGTVRIVALQDADVELRHAASFSVITDMQTT
jgi:HK97 family phage major capsid protein